MNSGTICKEASRLFLWGERTRVLKPDKLLQKCMDPVEPFMSDRVRSCVGLPLFNATNAVFVRSRSWPLSKSWPSYTPAATIAASRILPYGTVLRR